MLEVPFKELLMTQDLLLALEPDSHLTEFILVVACMVSILCEVDMEVFRVLSVVVICGAKQFNRPLVVVKGVELWELEVCPDAEVNEHLLVRMEVGKCFIKKGQCLGSVRGVLHKVKEVEDCMGHADEADRGRSARKTKTNDKPEKNPTDV